MATMADLQANIDTTTLPAFKFLPYTDAEEDRGGNRPEVTLRRQSTWTYCGPFLSPSASSDGSLSLPKSFYTWQRATVEAPGSVDRKLNKLLGFVHEFLGHRGIDNYWISLRATKPALGNGKVNSSGVVAIEKETFERPRWHTDDLFFDARLPSFSPFAGTTASAAAAASQPARRFWGGKAGKQPDASKDRGEDCCAKERKRGTRQDEENKKDNEQDEQRQEEENVVVMSAPTDFKLCTALLGPGTIFVDLPHQEQAREEEQKARACARGRYDHECVELRCKGCADAGEDVRASLTNTIGNPNTNIVPAVREMEDDNNDGRSIETGTRTEGKSGEFSYEVLGEGEVAFFRVGRDAGAVHSEPWCEQDRIFVNIVPGTEEELRTMMQRWGMTWPRDWSVGVPMGLD